MKTKQIILIILIACMVFVGCNDDSSIDSLAPAPITNIQFTPQNGGGYFTYSIPADADFLYVKAVYSLDSGQEVIKTASTYTNSLTIEGLGSVKEYPVKLYAVDRKGNVSAPIEKLITPLASNISVVLSSLKVKAGFSSLVVNWKNELKQTLDIYIKVKTADKEATKVSTSNLAVDYFTYNNLKGVPYEVSVFIKDSYGNQSQEVSMGSFTPMIDGKISKSKWNFLNDTKLYGNKWDYSSGSDASKQKPFPQFMGTYRSDSLKNASESFYEGSIFELFDDILDDRFSQNLNYFHTGKQLCPFSYFLDMGRTIKASRVKVWQRDYSTAYYGRENVQIFQLWISDDADATDGIGNWELVGTYTINKPSDALEAENTARAGHEFLLYPDDPRFSKPFRYLRYKALKYFGSTATGGCTSELSLFGTEEDGSISK